MTYVCTYKLHRPSGMTKKEMYDKFALGIIRIIRGKERRGLYGEEHPIIKEDVIKWLEEIGLKEKFICKTDKVHRDYRYFLYFPLYQNVWHSRIRKVDDLLEDDDDEDDYKNLNPFYLPELMPLDGIGYILTQKRKYVDLYRDQRDSKLLSQQKHLEKRCMDGLNFIQQLPEHHQDLLDDKDRDQDVT